MAARRSLAHLPPLDRTATRLPLHQQLYEAIRSAILSGQIAPATRVPATRALAADLFVSRNTVLDAYNQLLSEGYLEGKLGTGTFVSRLLPEQLLRTQSSDNKRVGQTAPSARVVSRRAASLFPDSQHDRPLIPYLPSDIRAFQVGLPAVDAFPHQTWTRLVARRSRTLPDTMSYKYPAGYRPLREAIAAHLGTARGIRCTWDQVIVVNGAQHALDIAVRTLLDPGDTAWIEEPGWPGARTAILAAGSRPIPVPVDSEGLNVEQGVLRGPDARLSVVTPSHQFPLGVTMSLARRLALLDWAERSAAWILEDDYDSEFRYTSRPLPALQTLAGAKRGESVIYCGTFSKALFPTLRIGYMVVPADLVFHFVAMRWTSGIQSSAIDQVVLADFITEGHFERHLRRMRSLYGERQEVLVTEARRELAGALTVEPVAAGMHAIGWVSSYLEDRAIADQAFAEGVLTWPTSAFMMEPARPNALMLGFSAPDPEEIRRGVQCLAVAISKVGAVSRC